MRAHLARASLQGRYHCRALQVSSPALGFCFFGDRRRQCRVARRPVPQSSYVVNIAPEAERARVGARTGEVGREPLGIAGALLRPQLEPARPPGADHLTLTASL